MKKMQLLAAAATLGLLASCVAGPHQLRRPVDDWDHKFYTSNPWIGAVMSVFVWPFVGFGAAIGDFFVVDAYHFWFKDAWDGKGTGFEHLRVESDQQVQSLLIDGAKFLHPR